MRMLESFFARKDRACLHSHTGVEVVSNRVQGAGSTDTEDSHITIL